MIDTGDILAIIVAEVEYSPKTTQCKFQPQEWPISLSLPLSLRINEEQRCLEWQWILLDWNSVLHGQVQKLQASWHKDFLFDMCGRMICSQCHGRHATEALMEQWGNDACKMLISLLVTSISLQVNNNSFHLNWSLPIITLLMVHFLIWFPSNLLSMSSTTKSIHDKQHDKQCNKWPPHSLSYKLQPKFFLYLFFATASTPGWMLQHSIWHPFPSITDFLMCLFNWNGHYLWLVRTIPWWHPVCW